MFTWSKSIETGIGLVDEQHRRPFGPVNDLNTAMTERKGKEVLGQILKELLDSTSYHFSLEEKAFAKYAYPKKDEHVKLHKESIGKIKDLQERFDRKEIALSIETLGFLLKWIQDHIMKADMEYVPFLKDKQL